MSREPRVPSYRLHRPSGQAVVTLSGRDYYLGVYDSPASRQLYDRLIAAWLAGGRHLHAPDCPSEQRTVSEVPCGEQRGRWLSPLEEQAVEALAGGEWMTTAQIIEVIGEEPSDLRVVLRNLAARGILESCTRRGFRLLD